MYINAEDVLPNSLLREVQKYVQGAEMYIPKDSNTRLGWGERNGTRLQLAQRNKEIYERYADGEHIEFLMEVFHLSYDSIRRIIREVRKEQL